MNLLFTGRNSADQGTLFHVKNIFGHKNVKKEVMHCFNHATHFLDFVTEGMICLLAIKILGIGSIQDDPEESDPSAPVDERKAYLRNIAKKSVASTSHADNT